MQKLKKYKLVTNDPRSLTSALVSWNWLLPRVLKCIPNRSPCCLFLISAQFTAITCAPHNSPFTDLSNRIKFIDGRHGVPKYGIDLRYFSSIMALTSFGITSKNVHCAFGISDIDFSIRWELRLSRKLSHVFYRYIFRSSVEYFCPSVRNIGRVHQWIEFFTNIASWISSEKLWIKLVSIEFLRMELM